MNKAQILEEIRRTAAENDGVPLGRQAFRSETGIRNCDWCGKYWAVWSDALREAGFPPNEMNRAYDKSLLLEKYAALARELGQLPSADHLRLKRRSDPEFPSHNVFTRFGSKSALVKKLLDYCRSREGYDDVIRMCEEHVAPARNSADEESHARPATDGFVYLFKSGRFYKIGKSNAVGRREYEIGIKLPEDLKKIHEIRTDDPSGIEAYWHKRFEAKRVKGEWFKLSAADVAAFKRRRRFM
jgi:hypothetical protein